MLTDDIIAALANNPNPRLIELLAAGSRPDLNEQAKWIIAQDIFLSKDPVTLKVKSDAILLAPRNEPVIIYGESGTGKELIATILHGARKGNLVAVNSTAVTENLFESELFGHMKGSFTGADTQRAGLISHANEGTLFFDEIGDMPLSLQPKLLRVIQSKKYRLVGGNTDQPVKCRIICATHMNLPELVKQGKFRLDLYQRLSTFELTIPPLRDRLCDLDLHIKDPILLNTILSANLPLNGNVRELQNYIARWSVFRNI
jgi:transcriptional regulator with PAS, ATPase and Fis domain